MPHYADGTRAKTSDLVIRREKYEHGTDLVGIVMSIQPGSDSCNAQLIPLALRQKGATSWLPLAATNAYCITLSECSKLGDDPDAIRPYDTKAMVENAIASG
jgi:hypothetical protein